jgi:hypothetical protein
MARRPHGTVELTVFARPGMRVPTSQWAALALRRRDLPLHVVGIDLTEEYCGGTPALER